MPIMFYKDGILELTFKKSHIKRDTALSSLPNTSFCSVLKKLWTSCSETVFILEE